MEPHQAVVIILLQATRCLIIQRAAGVPRPGLWTPPTGRVEPGESQAAAVAREAMEELAVVVQPRLCLWQCDSDDGRFRLYWWLADPAPGPLLIRANPAEVDAWRWVTTDQFLDMQPIFPQHRPFFERVLPKWLESQGC